MHPLDISTKVSSVRLSSVSVQNAVQERGLPRAEKTGKNSDGQADISHSVLQRLRRFSRNLLSCKINATEML